MHRFRTGASWHPSEKKSIYLMMNNYILSWDFLQWIQPLNHIMQRTCFLSNHLDK